MPFDGCGFTLHLTELDVAVRLSPVEDGLEVRARVADGEQVYMEYKGLMTVV